MGHLEGADLPFGVHELSKAFAVDGDGALGEREGVVHAEECGQHAGRLLLGVCVEVSERCAVEVLDLPGYLGGRRRGQAGAFTVGGAGPPRHAGVPGLSRPVAE
ncbi:protein of unknown function [Streptomyces murinus]